MPSTELDKRVNHLLVQCNCRGKIDGPNLCYVLNMLWPYSKGRTEYKEYTECEPFYVKNGDVVSNREVDTISFTRLVNERLIRDKIPYVVDIGQGLMQTWNINNGLRMIGHGYKFKIECVDLIPSRDTIIEVLSI